jgi:hypothetical protein
VSVLSELRSCGFSTTFDVSFFDGSGFSTLHSSVETDFSVTSDGSEDGSENDSVVCSGACSDACSVSKFSAEVVSNLGDSSDFLSFSIFSSIVDFEGVATFEGVFFSGKIKSETRINKIKTPITILMIFFLSRDLTFRSREVLFSPSSNFSVSLESSASET